MLRTVRTFAVGASVLVTAGLLTACQAVNTVARPAHPVVLTGADLSDLVGAAPGDVVAFRYSALGGTPTWTQIPVQVDERKVVGFGTYPGSNATVGVEGTVYGSAATGVTALQYADPGTFVGADTNPAFDADDELVFMAFDMGGRRAAAETSVPPGVVPGSGVEVEVEDPLAPVDKRERGWVYLFEASDPLDPSAGQDYVDYDFVLTSGDYETTYRRASGPNPETSRVVTATYEIRYSDRWKEDQWYVRAPGTQSFDLLDGHKNQFAVNYCGRSNQTFADGEGAFVANIDGPVRAIRSYVGANSGPLTQRTHLMYRDREDIVTDLRVHQIPGIMDFVDLSAVALGSTYRNSKVTPGVTIDGTNDPIPTAVPSWESINGPTGHVLMHSSFTTDISQFTVAQFYRDQTVPPENQCWGDGSFYGAAGPAVTSAIPNTDPEAGAHATLQARRTVQFGPPATDIPRLVLDAGTWAMGLEAELSVTATPLP